jgi:predicted dehydrogenase
MAESTKLRLAVIGCGRIGTLHAQAVARSPDAQLVAVCDTHLPRAQALAEPCAIQAYTEPREMFQHEALDAVTVATPDDRHAEVAIAALEAGCHVFCEKPLAASLPEARRMVETAAHHGVQLAVNYNRRYGFGYRKARELVDGGAIGPPAHLLFHVTDRSPSPDLARNPTVILTTLLTHHLDLARYYCGEVRSIHAEFSEPASDAVLRCDVALSLQFAGGAVGAIVAGYRDGQTRTAERMDLAGRTGALTVEDVTRRVTLYREDPDRVEVFRNDHFVHGDAFYDTLGEHLLDFLACLRARRVPPVSGFDGLRGLELAAAALRSHELGRPVETPAFQGVATAP